MLGMFHDYKAHLVFKLLKRYAPVLVSALSMMTLLGAPILTTRRKFSRHNIVKTCLWFVVGT